MSEQGRSLRRQLSLTFGLLTGIGVVLFALLALGNVWQNKVQAIGESGRYAAQFLAAVVAEPVALGHLGELRDQLHAIQNDVLITRTCIYGAHAGLLAGYGEQPCPISEDRVLTRHFYASHPVLWQNRKVGTVKIHISYDVVQAQMLRAMYRALAISAGLLVLAMVLVRVLAARASRSVVDLAAQLDRSDSEPLDLDAHGAAPREVRKLADAMNRRLTHLIEARRAAERLAAQRHDLEIAERRARQLIRNIIDLVPYVIYAQRPDGSLVFANRATAELYGTTVEKLIDPAFIRQDRHDCLIFTNSTPKEAQAEFSDRRLQIARVPFDGPQATLVIAIDVTESHRLQQQLQFSQRLEVVGTLAGGIAHDFNNLLTPMLGYASLLADQPLDADVLHKVRQIELAADKARRVVRQMLAFSRQQPTEHRPTDLGALLESVASLMRASVPATVQIIVRAEPLPTVLADPVQIEQVLVNLCTNAVQAIGTSDGRIELRACMTEIEDPTDVMPAGRYANIEVLDSGPGIEPEVMKHVFEPFFTTKDVGKGTGLGLSVAHGIVRNHGGDLFVANQPGSGAAFTILLPERSPLGAALPP